MLKCSNICERMLDAIQLFGYCDVDWEEDVFEFKSTSRYCFKQVDGIVSWRRSNPPFPYQVLKKNMQQKFMQARNGCGEENYKNMLGQSNQILQFQDVITNFRMCYASSGPCLTIEILSNATWHNFKKYVPPLALFFHMSYSKLSPLQVFFLYFWFFLTVCHALATY